MTVTSGFRANVGRRGYSCEDRCQGLTTVDHGAKVLADVNGIEGEAACWLVAEHATVKSENSEQPASIYAKSRCTGGNMVLHQDEDIVISGILAVRYHVKKIKDMRRNSVVG